jgi:hypothetical protein
LEIESISDHVVELVHDASSGIIIIIIIIKII